ncbi:heterokaryon incompatibility protein-domain-containing protein [Rhexocercosporidium sp. MPI-PUGE-AT-0058]|nr:heterokaryon incompatibility protein-domain-containing protein [Rhexocercosporidium sp. MPI-PUGE-AT-0058]
MPLCSNCESVLVILFSDDSATQGAREVRLPNMERVERWYRFSDSDGCQLCSMMELEISRDLFEGGFARISFEGSSTAIQGSVNDVLLFTFPVQMEELDSPEPVAAEVDLPGTAATKTSFIHPFPEFILPARKRKRTLERSRFAWSTARFLSETAVPMPNTGLGDKADLCAEPDLSVDDLSMTRFRAGSKDRKRAHLARTWIRECHDDHHLCKPHGWRPFSPTRLIDVENCRLVETRQKASSVLRYAALTHCWGPDMPEAGMTKRENLEFHKQEIDFSNLPRSFRDAILVSKSLGIQYLWIDSLCIIQDSVDDWEFESAQMGLVYSYAWCTIAASSAKNCHEGMNLVRQAVEVTCEFIAQDREARRVQVRILKPLPTWEKFYQNNPLNKRGWTFQERELSPRVLHFSADQIWWECRTLRRQEDVLAVLPLSRRRQRRVEKAAIRENINNAILFTAPAVNQAVQLRCLDKMLQDPWMPAESTSILYKFVVTEARYNTWHRVIEDYSKRTFSRITDRFPALSGLASEMQAAHGGEYVAGAWREDLLRSLLWRRAPRSIGVPPSSPLYKSFPRPSEYRVPSWSWAAIDQAVTYDLLTLHRSQIDQVAPTTARIESVTLVPNGLDPKGQLRDGFLHMRGKLKMHDVSDALSRDIKFHIDFEPAAGGDGDDEISTAPLFLLSLFARSTVTDAQLPLSSMNVMGWALVLVMVDESPEQPVFRRCGVACEVVSKWFEDAMDVTIKVV